jgi:hypothetical protein
VHSRLDKNQPELNVREMHDSHVVLQGCKLWKKGVRYHIILIPILGMTIYVSVSVVIFLANT